MAEWLGAGCDRVRLPSGFAVAGPLAMRRLRDNGKLTPLPVSCFVKPRFVEELYDLDTDPDEMVNLAENPKFAEALATMRKALLEWVRETNEKLSPDEFDRETGDSLPNRIRPKPTKPMNRSAGALKP
jgi:N-sulfoglucosamine sulfohydrolase